MSVIPQLAATMLPVFVIAGTGYAAVRAGLLSRAAMDSLGKLVFAVEIPVLLFRSMALQDFRHGIDLRINLVYFGGCFLVFMASVLIGGRVFRLAQPQAGVFGLAAAYSNSTLLGVPVIHAAFGASGLVLLSKIIAFHSLLLLPPATLVVVLGRNGPGGLAHALGRSTLAVLRTPIIVGLLAGLLWSLADLGLPPALDRVTVLLSDAATPTALLVLGGTQGGIGLGTLRAAGAMVALKLVAHPLLVYGLALAAGGLSPEAVSVAVVTASLPAGMNVYLLAQQYDCYRAEAAAATTLGTMLALISIAVALGLTVT